MFGSPAIALSSQQNRSQVLNELFQRVVPLIIAGAVTVGGILYVNPHSLLGLVYYFLLFLILFVTFHRDSISDYVFAYVVNSALISVFYVIQTTVYPESFGTSSPLGSWTDDSFFFALTADNIPLSLLLRENYNLYSSPYSDIMRFVSLIPINHPMDVIFFQSGVAAILTSFLKRFTMQQTGDPRAANVAYILALVCPFLLMNGGALLIRDTLSAALFIYSLSCFNRRQWPLALAALILQIVIRPGTGIILLPLYFIIYMPNLNQLTAGRVGQLVIGMPIVMVLGSLVAVNFLDLSVYSQYFDKLSLSGRDAADFIAVDANANGVLIAIQNMPFAIRFLLNGAYIFLYPFLSIKAAFPSALFDTRSFLLSLAAPIEGLWLNAWFFAGAISRARASSQQRQIALAVIVGVLIIGTYSMQTRHKTIIYPIYYFIIALGFTRSSATERRIGYAISGFLILLQLLFLAR